ncbi:hypothetical protein CEXT_192081 [Caerostris extrusa]|uniref:Uncharacterized protein n=1 Tax=Caerostris extrusa TaxID=172846 RepID=A0AAV4TNV3_CAEEX|nr:hypothetical protein CEXT_192081 [Caerostris extrusa]
MKLGKVQINNPLLIYTRPQLRMPGALQRDYLPDPSDGYVVSGGCAVVFGIKVLEYNFLPENANTLIVSQVNILSSHLYIVITCLSATLFSMSAQFPYFVKLLYTFNPALSIRNYSLACVEGRVRRFS